VRRARRCPTSCEPTDRVKPGRCSITLSFASAGSACAASTSVPNVHRRRLDRAVELYSLGGKDAVRTWTPDAGVYE